MQPLAKALADDENHAASGALAAMPAPETPLATRDAVPKNGVNLYGKTVDGVLIGQGIR